MLTLTTVVVPMALSLILLFSSRGFLERSWRKLALFIGTVLPIPIGVYTLSLVADSKGIAPLARLLEVTFPWLGETTGAAMAFGVEFTSVIYLVLSALVFTSALVVSLLSGEDSNPVTAVVFTALAGSVYGYFLAQNLFTLLFFWFLSVCLVHCMKVSLPEGYRAEGRGGLLAVRLVGVFIFLLITLLLSQKSSLFFQNPTLAFADLERLRLAGSASVWVFFGLMATFLPGQPFFPLHFYLTGEWTDFHPLVDLVEFVVFPMASVYGLSRLAFIPGEDLLCSRWVVASVIASGTVYAALVALRSDKLLELLPWVSMLSFSPAVVALLLVTPSGVTAGEFQGVAACLITGGFCLIIATLRRVKTNLEVSELNIVLGSSLTFSTVTTVLLLAATGAVGTVGFSGYLAVLIVVFRHWVQPGVIIVTGLFFGLIFSLKFIQNYMVETETDQLERRTFTAKLLRVVLIAWIVLLITPGFFPKPVFTLLGASVKKRLTRQPLTPESTVPTRRDSIPGESLWYFEQFKDRWGI